VSILVFYLDEHSRIVFHFAANNRVTIKRPIVYPVKSSHVAVWGDQWKIHLMFDDPFQNAANQSNDTSFFASILAHKQKHTDKSSTRTPPL